ncbi:hypothetical protein N7478_004415 [Penicillium angulare]|uniref:uncharacterized protein n=1 Tax=Penicillium angulare TaxID=116970 RepID=UPI00253FF757|nr:uncharacterized protein N7478_004415 [Penicillium angulare]KAJ5279043.1 hypothetical protein N7478_004415 [Penicillium angulare]
MEDDHKNLERLARVRDNQRKSRARKQEYVRELELRLGDSNEQAHKKDIEYRLSMQKLEAENRHLKTLLGSLGVSPDLVQQYVHLASQGTVVDQKVAIPAAPRPKEEPSPEPASSSNEARLQPPSESIRTPEVQLPEVKASSHVQVQNPSLCECFPDQQIGNSCSSDGDVLNTTLCSIAEDLVRQYNARGIDTDEIRQRLWAGFKKGQVGEGCRVQNNMLFQVLDDISNGI